MGLTIERTVRRIGPKGAAGPQEPLSAYRQTAAWVLLGDPGAGKTTVFRFEASLPPPNAHLISARDFLTFDAENRPEWQGRTLFLDGLDEVRAGQSDVRMPFDEIRRRLARFGKPRFRLSCREADWLGKNDREHLKSVSPDGEVVVLRLDPLTRDEVRSVASDLVGNSLARSFFAAVSERGLDSVLGNPQNLVLLTRVFRESGQLPSSRWETFEQASALLALERNHEHEIGEPRVPAESILDAAGRLSAVELLSDADGHCDPQNEAADGCLAISAYGETRRSELLAALRTRLFAVENEGRFRPAHAHLAAFLAARLLAHLLENGVPTRRILALLAGPDGAPPSRLRGLAGWLAAAAPALRRQLVERDPVAVLIYGDIRDFDPDEKALLLDRVGRDASRLYESYWPTSAVEALASTSMKPVLLGLLQDTDRSRATQSRVEVITKALRTAQPGVGPSAALLAVVEDPTYWPRVRRPALDAWIRSIADKRDRVARFRKVLIALQEGRVSDPDRELLGTLLAALYPDHLRPREVWTYFHPPREFLFGRFFRFWSTLAETSPPRHLRAHLDYLASAIGPLRLRLQHSSLEAVPVNLLARALRAHGSGLDASRLVRWLRVGLNDLGYLSPDNAEHASALRAVSDWLTSNSDDRKRVVRFVLQTEEFRSVENPDYYFSQMLYGSRPSDDIATWHLDEAADTEAPRGVEFHLRGLLQALADRPVDVDRLLKTARQRLKASPEAIDFLDRNLQSTVPEWRLKMAAARLHIRTKTSQPNTKLLEEVRLHETSLRKNCAPGGLLHWIARTYYGKGYAFGEGNPDRVLRALGGDHDLTSAALSGVLDILNHRDLPTATEILRARRQSLMSVFVLPTLAAMQYRSSENLTPLTASQWRTALACRLCFYGFSQEAQWYSECAQRHPDLVAEVLVLFGRALLRTRKETFPDYFSLAYLREFARVARLATESLLRAFPARASGPQLDNLNQLLWSGLQHLDTARFRTLIKRKLKSKHLTRMQRTRWLAAGLASDPKHYLRRLSHDIGDSQPRVRDLASFFAPDKPVPGLTKNLNAPAHEFLVRVLGRLFEPIREEGVQTIRTEASQCVEGLIQKLEENGTLTATSVLARLASDGDLEKWRWRLERARESQRVARRDAGYEAPQPEAVIEALRDGEPANAADLRELVMDRFETIAEEMRTTNANPWRPFWNQDSKDRVLQPKHENACRDALLALLRPRLPKGCDAQPEGQYAANRRADIRVTSGKWNVPVEIKKNGHSGLWRAVRNQLLPRYANDPATEGLGIYLVLWMGADRTAPLEKGDRPGTPAELRERLLAALKPDERRRAEVVVLDVTPPDGAAGQPGQAPKISRK